MAEEPGPYWTRWRRVGAGLLFGGVALVLAARFLGLGEQQEFTSIGDVGSGPLQVAGLLLAGVGAVLTSPFRHD